MSWPSWSAAAADDIWSKGERTVAEAMALVVEGVDEKNRKGKKGVYYNGYRDASKVLPGFSATASEYYRAARELGDAQVAARMAIEAQLGGNGLNPDQKRLFKNWNMEGERAVKLVVGLRRKDLNEFVIKQMRRPLYFGRRIARMPMAEYEEFVKMQGAMQPDRGGTIVTYELEYPAGREQLIKDYHAAMRKISRTQDNRAHRKAVKNWELSNNQIMGCK